MTYNRYDNGKIYQITNNLNDMVYIGSTCLPLRKRWYNHKNEMNHGKGSTRRLFQMAAQIGWDEMRITRRRSTRGRRTPRSAASC